MFGAGVGARLGAAIGTIIGGYVANSGQSAPATQLNDLDIERYEYGSFVNEFYGTMGNTSGTIIDCRYAPNEDGDRVPAGIEKVIVKGHKSGTGASPKPPEPDTAAYYLSAAYMFGKGPLDYDLIEWEDSEKKRVIYDRSGASEIEQGFDLTRQWEPVYANMPTSATSVTIGTGSKTFTTQAGKELYRNTYIRVASASDATKYMEGTITAYDGTTLTVNVTSVNGSGTYASWHIHNVTAEISDGLRLYRGLWSQPTDSVRESWHPEGVNADRGKSYILLNHFEVKSTGRLTARVRSPITGRKEILTAKCLQAGIPPSRLNFTQLTGDIRGATVTQREGANGLIEKLLMECQFDIANIDGLLTDRNRANPVYWTIPVGDLGAHEWSGNGEDVPDSITIEMANPTEFPSAVTVRYRNISNNYETETVTATRQTATHVNVVTVEFPFVFTPEEALRLAYVILDEAWMAQWQGTVSLLPAHLRAAAADVLIVPDEDNAPRVFRIQRQKISDDDLIECVGPAYDGGVYGQYRSIDIPERPVPGVKVYAAPLSAVWEGVPLDDTMAAKPGVLSCASTDGAWNGAILRSDETSGLGMQTLPYRATMGTMLTAYTYDPEDTTEFSYGVTIRVRLAYGGLAPTTEALARNREANSMVLLTDNGALYIQFIEATQVNATDWDISGIIPGRKGSEYVTGASIGDTCVLLTDEDGVRDSAITWIELPMRLLDTDIDYTMEANSTAMTNDGTHTIHFDGDTLKPLAPVRVRLVERTATSVRFAWDERTRYETGASWALTRQSDPTKFRVVANGVVKIVTDTEVTYFDSDFVGVGGLPSSLSGTVQQQNTLVGNGWAATFSGI